MFDFTFRLFGSGWLEAELTGDGQELSIQASHLSDAPADLLISVNQLLNGRPEATCCWQEEPGAYQWVLTKEGRDVFIKLYWYDKSFPKYSDKAPVVFSGRDEMIRFARCILRAFSTRALGVSASEYQKMWGYGYPEAELSRLRTLIKKSHQP